MRAALSGLMAAAVSVGAVGPGGPDPSVELAAERMVRERTIAALAALEELETGIDQGLEAARRGAARIVSGEDLPGRGLSAAGGQLAEAEPLARRAGSALRSLNAASRARHPAATAVEPPVASGELASIGAQLESTASAGDAFVAGRTHAAEVTVALDRSLAALAAGDLAGAQAGVEEARESFTAVEAWEVDLVTLPVWLDTTGAMIGAVETIIAASAEGDAERARDAAERFAALAEDGAVADRALRIAISEGGSAVPSAALSRLAAAKDAVRRARADVAAMLQAADR